VRDRPGQGVLAADQSQPRDVVVFAGRAGSERLGRLSWALGFGVHCRPYQDRREAFRDPREQPSSQRVEPSMPTPISVDSPTLVASAEARYPAAVPEVRSVHVHPADALRGEVSVTPTASPAAFGGRRRATGRPLLFAWGLGALALAAGGVTPQVVRKAIAAGRAAASAGLPRSGPGRFDPLDILGVAAWICERRGKDDLAAALRALALES